MSNPTSNFGWQMPTPTDLVTSLPADFEVFGQAVDTSMADLKGGTTGQVLSKNSNTDMDFVWVTDAAGDITGVTAGTGISGGGTSGTVTITNSMATEITAKGDLIVGTGSATFDNLAAGANGSTIVADSSTSTGLRWQGHTEAGKNRIINGAMDFWQRGTTFGPTASTGYFTADRWRTTLNANTITLSQETSIVPSGFQYAFKLTAGTGGSQPYLQQFIESQNCQDLAGKTVTLSAYCATSTSVSVDFVIEYNTTFGATSATGGWTSVSSSAVSTTASMPTSPQSAQFAIPSTAKALLIYIRSSANLAAAATLSITGVQLELGSVATAFSRAGGTIQGELAACQRYYWRNTQNANLILSTYGNATSTTVAYAPVPYPVTMRITPTALDYSSVYLSDTVNAFTGIASVGIGTSTNALGEVAVTINSGSLTQFRTYKLVALTNGGYVGFSAEL